MNQNPQLDKDARDLQKLGYVQELLRDMGGFSNFAVSFSVISILTGATQLYGYGLQHGGPLQMSAGWLVVSLFTMTVALSMAELASSYPTAGALYHWSSILGGRAVGWFTACFNTIGQFAILAGIDYGLSQFLIGFFGWPATPMVSIGLYAALLLSHAWLNHTGIHIVSLLNNFSAWYHIAVVAFLIIALMMKGLSQPISFLGTFKSSDSYAPPYSFLIGLLLAQWTLTGYDASAHVTEETHNPRKNAPWGIFLAVVISVIFGFGMLSVITLSIPDLDQAMSFGDNAFVEIFKLRLGPQLGGTIVLLVAGAMWLCGLAAMTSASRMVYAFARDGGLPFSKTWARVSPRHFTPSNAIWGLSALAMILALSVKIYSAVISIATISLYISYGIPIAARLYARMKSRDAVKGPWSLGKFSSLNAVVAVLWISFITIVFVLPPNDQAMTVVGVCVLALVLLWFSFVRHRFKGPKFQFKG
jgi:amino acid transporter